MGDNGVRGEQYFTISLEMIMENVHRIHKTSFQKKTHHHITFIPK